MVVVEPDQPAPSSPAVVVLPSPFVVSLVPSSSVVGLLAAAAAGSSSVVFVESSVVVVSIVPLFLLSVYSNKWLSAEDSYSPTFVSVVQSAELCVFAIEPVGHQPTVEAIANFLKTNIVVFLLHPSL